MKCPLCQSAKSERRFKAHGFWIRDCAACRHRFAEVEADAAHVAETYADDYFSGGGAGYADYFDKADLLRARGRGYARLLRERIAEPGAVLDVGAAAGFVLQGLVESGWRGRGVEPNETMARFARENLRLEVEAGTLEDFDAAEKFDLVTMIQVVAHFYDVGKAFENARRVLKDNGFLLIETWNCESRTARAFGKNWHEYSPPSVLHYFTPAGLSDFAARYGFEKAAQGRPSKKIRGAHAKSLLKHKFNGSSLKYVFNLIPDRVNLPYPAEDLFWILFRKTRR